MFKLTLLIAVIVISYLLPNKLHASTCYGKANCRACKTCNYCKHCNEGGGTCGVCGGGERETVSTSNSDNSNSNTSTGSGSNLGTTLVVGAGVAGAAYYIGKSSRKK